MKIYQISIGWEYEYSVDEFDVGETVISTYCSKDKALKAFEDLKKDEALEKCDGSYISNDFHDKTDIFEECDWFDKDTIGWSDNSRASFWKTFKEYETVD